MKIKSTIKIDSVKETTSVLLDQKIKLRYMIQMVLFVLLLIFSLIIKNNTCFFLSIIASISNILSYLFLLKAKEDVATKIFKKIYPKNEYILDVHFKKDKIDFINNHFTKKIIIEYNEIKKIKETKNYIIMILTNKSHFLFSKNDVDINDIKKRIGKVKK